jgi:hypothetical protein
MKTGRSCWEIQLENSMESVLIYERQGERGLRSDHLFHLGVNVVSSQNLLDFDERWTSFVRVNCDNRLCQ